MTITRRQRQYCAGWQTTAVHSHWRRCLRSAEELQEEWREIQARCWITPSASAYWTRWRQVVCFREVPCEMEFTWSRCHETSADATDRTMLSYKDKRIRSNDWMWQKQELEKALLWGPVVRFLGLLIMMYFHWPKTGVNFLCSLCLQSFMSPTFKLVAPPSDSVSCGSVEQL